MKIRNKVWASKLTSLINKHKKNISEVFYSKHTVPNEFQIFNAFERCPYNKLKVVIIGSDPYPNESDANGVAFSVSRDYKLPKTLNNIYKALKVDLGIENTNGNLNKWANQGVLLLNSSLTTERNLQGGHFKVWRPFIEDVIKVLNRKKLPLVWSLWGNQAKSLEGLITSPDDVIIKHVHPSPRVKHNEFVFSKPFSKINDALIELGYEEIDWSIQ